MPSSLKSVSFAALLSLILSISYGGSASYAGDLEPQELEEIHQLIAAIETSDCQFIRNGSQHDASSAANHLRLKLKRGGRYINTSEEFIDRLASKSSWSGKAYTIECPGQPVVNSSQWLHAQLQELRAL